MFIVFPLILVGVVRGGVTILTLPSTVVEGAGVLTSVGQVNLGVVATSNVVTTLVSSDPAALAVPTNVTVTSGRSNILFNITVGNYLPIGLNVPVTVTATNVFSTNITSLLVLSNDPAYIQVGPVPPFIDTNSAFSLVLTAMNADGSVRSNFNKIVTLAASGPQGPLPLASSNSGVFSGGNGTAAIQVLTPAKDVTMTCLTYPGQSGAFDVIPIAFWRSPQAAADIVWVPGSKMLLATVPANGGAYSNNLVAIDPGSGLTTNAYPLANNPGEVEISPDGTYLYIAVSNATALQRFDLTTMMAGAPFALGSNANGTRFVYNFCIPPGFPDSVVVAARYAYNLGTSIDGIYRFDRGNMVALSGLSASGGYWVESMDAGHEVALSPPLAEGDASTGSILSPTANGSVPFIFRDGNFYDFRGNVFNSMTLAQVGTYPSVLDQVYYQSVFEEDPFYRRTYYLEGYFNYGSAFYTLKVFDRDLFEPLFELPMPLISGGAPSRMIRGGTNYLAYVTSNDQLWFIRPDATQPPGPAADLSISVATPASQPMIGSNYIITLTLSNAGPGIASMVQVTNLLPTNTTVAQPIPSTGSVTLQPSSSSFVWQVADLAPGTSATLQLALVFANGGWQTNVTWALGFESDPVFTNNVATLPVNGILPQAYGVYQIAFPLQDLLYDPVRDRLLLSVSTAWASIPSNCIAVFNPYSGETEATTPLTSDPGRIVSSDNGGFLYVSLPDLGTVESFYLPTLAPISSFAVGGEQIYGLPYTNYAADLAVVPGQPQSVVIWQVRHPNAGSLAYGYGLGLYQNGVLAPNVTGNGGSWEIVFDTNAGVLLGYDAGTLQQYTLSASGVTLTNTFPAFAGGSQMAYGAGHLFASGGFMVDYNPFNVDWQFAGAQSSALAVPDPVTGRAFFLLQNGNWQINGYDIASRRLLGTVVVSNVVGTPVKMIRWGPDGLALTTTGNQLFLVRAAMVTSNNFADVAVTLSGPGSPVSLGALAPFTVTVTNQGSLPAMNVVVSNTISGGGPLLSVLPGSGTTFTTNAGGTTVVWTIPLLNPGGQASLTCSLNATVSGLATLQSVANSTTFDPNLTNNASVATFLVGAPPGLDNPVIFTLPGNDVAWSAALGQLVLTVNAGISPWAGSLLSVDPLGFGVQCLVPVGSDCARLAVSSDGTTLYARTDGGVATIGLPAATVSNLFLINVSDPSPPYVFDMAVQPGSNQIVAIGAKDGNDAGTWILANDAGQQLTNGDFFYTTTTSLLFGPASSPLYVYNGSALNCYASVSNGLALIDSTGVSLPYRTTLNLAWAGGRIFASSGQVINPSPPSLAGTLTGMASGSLVASDMASGRVFFLSPGTGQAVLTAFDAATQLPAGSRIIPGVSGTIQRFIRWGTDGFAAITSSNQLAVFQSSLIPTNPPVDVSVSFGLSSPPFIQGSDITELITISNAGPNPATSVSWSNALPAGAVVQNAAASSGIVTPGLGTVVGFIPNLASGTAASVTVTFALAQSGIATLQATVNASSIDTNFANNVESQVIWVQGTNNAANLISLMLPVKDMEPDPIRPVIYASIGTNGGPIANSVVVLDPLNQIISAPVFVGSNPGKLAASHDGQSLYVVLDGSATVEKLTLPGLTPVTSFAVPQGQSVTRIQVCPTNSDMVVLRRSPAGMTSLHLAGVEMPNELSAQDLFAFLDTTGQLFGCDSYHSNVKLYKLDTSGNGLALLAGQPGKQSLSSNLVASGGLLFYNGGMVVNPATGRVVDIIAVPYPALVAPDSNCARVFYVVTTNFTWSVHAFDIAQGIDVGAVPLPALASAPQKFFRWGPQGLAFYNNSSQIVILQGQLIPTNPPIDVSVSQNVSSLIATTNDTISVNLQLTNSSLGSASGLVVTQAFSFPLTNVSVAASVGTASYTNGAASWQVGSFATNAGATLTVSGRPTQTATLTITASAYHNENDVFWGNNVAINTINILGTNTSNTVQIRLGARELVYDPARDVIYASTPASNHLAGNLIATISPSTGALTAALPAGSEPDQICLSSDASYLHVALDGATGAQRFNLTSNIADLSFPFTTNDLSFAQDLIAQPESPQTVVASLGSYNFASGYPSTVLAYDSGVPQAASGGTAKTLTFSPDGSIVYGNLAPGNGPGVEQMPLGPQGFFPARIVSGFTSTPGTIREANERLYGGNGQLIDPNTGTFLGSFGVTGPDAIDLSVGRAYYLAATGTNWQLRAFDLTTLQSVGTQPVPGVLGTPAGLIRCGQNRLAFFTSAGQIFLLHSSLVLTNPAPVADLAVSQTVVQDFSAPIETLRFTIAVTNFGPGFASNVLLTIAPPSPLVSNTVQLTRGILSNSDNNYSCALGTLAPGQTVSVLLSTVITNTGYFTNLVSLSAATPDPNTSNNTLSVSIQGQFFQRAQSYVIYPGAADTVAFDAVRQHLVVTLAPSSSNNVLDFFNPESGALLGSIPIDLAPTEAHVTGDSRYLYLSSTSSNLVERINLSTMTVDMDLAPPQASVILATATIPGEPHSFAVTYKTNSSAQFTAVYDDTVPRSEVVTDQPFTILTASDDATALFGYSDVGTGSPKAYRMSLTTSGVQEVDHGPLDTPFVYTTVMAYHSNDLYFGSGDVLQPGPWTVQPSISVPPGANRGGLVFLPGPNLVGIVGGDSSDYVHLGIYNTPPQAELQQVDIGTQLGGGTGLAWCGADRFAIPIVGGFIIVRSSAVPTADLSVSGSFAANQIMAGDTASLQITVSNAGPDTVTNVFLTNVLPVGFNLVSNTLSQGSLVSNGQTLVFLLGPLNANTNATFTLSFSLDHSRVLLVTNAITVTNCLNVADTDLPDPVSINNQATSLLTLTPQDTDLDGIPDYWDLAYGFSTNNPGTASQSATGDGIANLQKFFNGANPFAFDGLAIKASQLDLPTNLSLTVFGEAGMTYSLQTSPDLLRWTSVSNFLCLSTNQQVQVPFSPAAPAEFYRIAATTNLPTPILNLLNPTALSQQTPVLQIITPPGFSYTVSASSNLVDWTILTNFYSTYWNTQFGDWTAVGAPYRFYKATLP